MVKVTPGTIRIEVIHGRIGTDSFILFVSLREKYVEALAHTESPARVLLSAGGRTLRNGQPIIELADEESTEIEIPGDWYVEASVARYTCRIVGVRRRRGILDEAEVEMSFREKV